MPYLVKSLMGGDDNRINIAINGLWSAPIHQGILFFFLNKEKK